MWGAYGKPAQDVPDVKFDDTPGKAMAPAPHFDSLHWFGTGGGHQGGQFDSVHVMAVDSRAAIYVGESLEGKRVQRFSYKGIGPAGVIPPQYR
jgi:hypothetical protein